MYKIFQKQIDNNILKLAFITSFIYILLFNSPIFIYKFNNYNSSIFKIILELGKDFIYIYIALFITFFGLTSHYLIFFCGGFFLFFTGAIVSYYIFFLEKLPNYTMVEAFYNEHLFIAYEHLNIKLMAWLIFTIFVYLYTIRYFKVANTNLFLTRILSAACLLLTVNFIISPPNQIFKNYLPYQYLHYSYLYFSKKNLSLDDGSFVKRNYIRFFSYQND